MTRALRACAIARRAPRLTLRSPGSSLGAWSHGMQCSRCQTENPPQAKFCLECAAPLPRACPGCGTLLPPAAKFCVECAQPVGTAAPGPARSRFGSPQAYTPQHLAQKILTSRSLLEG